MAPPEEIDETQILGALLGIGEMVGSLTDTEEVLEAIVRIAPSLVRVDRCALMSYDDARREFRTLAAFGPAGSAEAFTGLSLAEADAPRLAQRLVKQRLPVILKDVAKDSPLPAALAQRLGVRSALVAPLVCRGRVLGVLWLDSTSGSHYFTSKEINIIQGIATEAAIALDAGQNLEEITLERRRFDALSRSLCDGVVVMDADLRVLSLDTGAEKLLGWMGSEVRGRLFAEVFDVTEGQASVGWTRETSGPAPIPKELGLRAQDGARVACDVLTAVVRDDGGSVRQILYALRKKPGSKDAEERAVDSLRHLEDAEEPATRPE